LAKKVSMLIIHALYRKQAGRTCKCRFERQPMTRQSL
jgi:hypothetical protein